MALVGLTISIAEWFSRCLSILLITTLFSCSFFKLDLQVVSQGFPIPPVPETFKNVPASSFLFITGLKGGASCSPCPAGGSISYRALLCISRQSLEPLSSLTSCICSPLTPRQLLYFFQPQPPFSEVSHWRVPSFCETYMRSQLPCGLVPIYLVQALTGI